MEERCHAGYGNLVEYGIISLSKKVFRTKTAVPIQQVKQEAGSVCPVYHIGAGCVNSNT